MELKAKWEYPQIPEGSTNLNHLLFQIKSPTDTGAVRRQPLVLILVLDKSWSMKGDKLASVIDAAGSFVNWLTRHDYVGIVAYSSDVQIVQPVTRLDEKKSIINKLQSIQPGTATNLSGGWLQGLKMASEADVKGGIRRVILLTDGLATMGIQSDEQLNNIAQKHYQSGISTTTIGFGSDFNETSLLDISKAGNGNFYYVDSPEKTSDIFFREFGEVGSLYAQAVELEMNFSPKVKFLEMFDEMSPEIRDNKLRVQIGDMRSDDTRNVLVAVEVNAEEGIPENPVSASLSYYRIDDTPVEEKVEISTSLTAGTLGDPDNEVEIELIVSWSGKTMMQAASMAEMDIKGANKILENMITRVQSNLKLSPAIFNSLIARMRDMQRALREDLNIARKQLLATGSVIYTDRSEIGIYSNVDLHDQIFVHKPPGDLDLYNSPELKSIVKSKLEEGYRFVIFDLSDCGFIDSSAIGTMIQISNWLARRGGTLIVSNLSSTLEKIFAMTRIDMYIPVAESVTGAKMAIESRKTGG
ncbi:MAG: anti-sigma factor antagonist [Leptospiraceae bacterium]|nr:anti-sigma factor antagonist [Leptospiraceae bacterium]